MNKTIVQGFVIVMLFLTTWFLLMQINWVAVFHVQSVTDKTERKLGELFWDVFQKTEKENKNQFVNDSVDSIVTKICNANAIDRSKIKIHILDKGEINAFALPDGHLVIYSGLILNADDPEELSGVIGHELAHIQMNHVMKKMMKEIGLSVIISMTTNSGSPEVVRKAARMLSSTAFDRSLESEADRKSVDYLVKAKIDPEPFANFMYKIADKENESTKYITWISTHPESKERAEEIIKYSKDRAKDYESVLSDGNWELLKIRLKEFN